MDLLKVLRIEEKNYGSSTGREWFRTNTEGELKIYSPTNGEYIASVYQCSPGDYEKVMKKAEEAYKYWRTVPAPKRERLYAR